MGLMTAYDFEDAPTPYRTESSFCCESCCCFQVAALHARAKELLSKPGGKGGTAMARHVMISAAMVRPRVMLEDAECWSNAGYKAASYS